MDDNEEFTCPIKLMYKDVRVVLWITLLLNLLSFLFLTFVLYLSLWD